MKAFYIGLVVNLALVLGVIGAEASPTRAQSDVHGGWWASAMQQTSSSDGQRQSRRSGRSARDSEDQAERGSSSVGPRPSQWCGWWMRTQRGGGPEYNLAWNWTRYGSPGSPQVGAVVVWRHHVGEIVGQASNGQWVVRSGNDGGQVRSRARSIAGAVVRV